MLDKYSALLACTPQERAAIIAYLDPRKGNYSLTKSLEIAGYAKSYATKLSASFWQREHVRRAIDTMQAAQADTAVVSLAEFRMEVSKEWRESKGQYRTRWAEILMQIMGWDKRVAGASESVQAHFATPDRPAPVQQDAPATEKVEQKGNVGVAVSQATEAENRGQTPHNENDEKAQ